MLKSNPQILMCGKFSVNVLNLGSVVELTQADLFW